MNNKLERAVETGMYEIAKLQEDCEQEICIADIFKACGQVFAPDEIYLCYDDRGCGLCVKMPECTLCQGSGLLSNDTECPRCNGVGYYLSQVKVMIDQDQRLRELLDRIEYTDEEVPTT
jgi:hypothetical protein